MYIKSTRLKPETPTPGKTGLLMGIENPSPELAEAAQRTLGLETRPSSLVIGLPSSALELTPLEKAIVSTGVAAAKMVTKELAKSSNNPLVKHGVDAMWLCVKVWKLYDKRQAERKNLPALWIDTTSTALSAAGLALEATDTPNAFFDDDLLQEDISLLFTASKAAVTGEPVSMALINRQFSATEAGKALGVVSPLLQAALDRDPAFAGVKLSPLPSFKTQ